MEDGQRKGTIAVRINYSRGIYLRIWSGPLADDTGGDVPGKLAATPPGGSLYPVCRGTIQLSLFEEERRRGKTQKITGN